MATPSTSLNLVDSSGWIEYFTNSPNSGLFAPAIEDTKRLIVPTLSILEVFKWVLRERDENATLKATALMQRGRVVELDAALRCDPQRLTHRLPLADSVIYATTQAHGATLWTQDADFEDLPRVHYAPKQSR